MSSDALTVSIIIVTHNSRATILDCLSVIPAACGETSREIIVIDNRSTDGTPDLIREKAAEVRIIQQTRNIGFGRACNAGALAAVGEYLLFLNPDAMLDSGAVPRLLNAQIGQSRTAFAVPRLRFPDGRFHPSCRHLPTIGNMVFSRGSSVMKIVSQISGNTSTRYTLPDYGDTTPVPAVAGTVAMIPRALFMQVGGFDPRFFLYMEDTDLCARLGQNGYQHLFVPRAGAVHRWGRGSAAGKLIRIARHHMSVWKYFLKHYPNGFSVILLPLILLVNGLVAAMLADRREEM